MEEELELPKDPQLQTISINLPKDLVRRVQTLAFHEEFSASSIVEKSLEMFLGQASEGDLADRLRGLGATLRRA